MMKGERDRLQGEKSGGYEYTAGVDELNIKCIGKILSYSIAGGYLFLGSLCKRVVQGS